MADINLKNYWTSSTGNGVTDDTAIFKQALAAAKGGTLYIPKSSVAYSIDNLVIPSNIHIVFEAGTVVQANAGLPINQPLFKISYASNVIIDGNGATFGMAKSQYTSGGGGTHTFSVIHSSNITLNNIKVSSSGGGDGIYINDVTNVRVSSCSVSGCLRNGLALIGADGAIVENSIFSKNKGNGMCIEPNSPADILNDVVFQNCLSESNGSYGLSLGLDKYKTETSKMYVDVTFTNITTRRNGGDGLRLGVYNFTYGIGGTVDVNNYTSDGDKLAMNISNSGSTSPLVTIDNWKVLNPTSYTLSTANYMDTAWIRDLSAINSGKIDFNQGAFTATSPTGASSTSTSTSGSTTTTPTTTTPTTTTPTTTTPTTGTTILGTTGSNTLNGTSGNDVIDGKGGVDKISASDGNDTIKYYASSTPGYINGGNGTDTLDASAVASSTNLSINLGNYVNMENLTGGAGGDTLTGTSGNNVLYGGAGLDYLYGSTGNDTLWGGAGTGDRLTGGTGRDVYLLGIGDGADKITSSSVNYEDTIMFNAGVKLSDLSVKLLSNKDLVISCSSTDSMTIQNWGSSSGNALNTVQFAGSSTKYKLTMTNGVASWSTIA